MKLGAIVTARGAAWQKANLDAEEEAAREARARQEKEKADAEAWRIVCAAFESEDEGEGSEVAQVENAEGGEIARNASGNERGGEVMK